MLSSFASQLTQGLALTEKQATVSLKIISKYEEAVTNKFQIDIEYFLQTPIYKMKFRSAVSGRKIKLIDDPVRGKLLKVEFPYNEELITKLRTGAKTGASAYSKNLFWDQETKSWMLKLNEYSIKLLMGFVESYKFEVDDTFARYAEQIRDIENNLESHIPMLSIKDQLPVLLNVSANMPKITATNWLEAAFDARKLGICTWDDTLSSFINSNAVDEISKLILTNSFATPLSINSITTPIHKLSTIVHHLSPCLVIVPGGYELEQLTKVYNWLSSMGIKNSEMSVMFRMPSSSNKQFNDFVKLHELNSAIHDQTRVVVVSGRLPKTVIRSGITFNSVISMGFKSAHYTLKEYTDNHQNFISYTGFITAQQELTFGNM
jgi:hypothetical protein